MGMKIQTRFIQIIFTPCFVGCAALGEPSKGARLKRVESSSQYSVDIGAFKNENPDFKMTSDMWGVFKEMLSGDQLRVPSEPLPEVKPDLVEFDEVSDDIKFIWFGHSTFLIRLEGKTILVDPVFGAYASPVPIFAKRFQPALLTASGLSGVDYVVISHDHYDHLEMETVEHFAKTGTEFIVPLGIGAHLERWGVGVDKITELDWWEHTEKGGIKFTCTPAQHFSGRRGVDGNDTLWASWAIKGATRNIYYSGDSGYFSHYKLIGERLGPFDLTFLENGQYDERWHDVHQLPEQAVQAHLDLQGNILVPVHWGAYLLAFHDWFDPAERVTNEAEERKTPIISPKLGQLVRVSNLPEFSRWWRDSKDFAAFQQSK